MLKCSYQTVSIQAALLTGLLFLLAGLQTAFANQAASPYSFNDLPTDYDGGYPDWFKKSFYNLPEDLEEALDDGKQGIIVYFGQKHCPYCKAIVEQNLSKPDVVEYVRKHFDVIGLNIHSIEEITDIDGTTMPIKQYAVKHKANFTPTIIFYTKGPRQALKLTGFYPPYKMQAALEYVVDGYYENLSFGEYLAKADPPPRFEEDKLNPDQLFMPPPYALDRSHFPAKAPLVVFFEQAQCHACDVLHSEPLQNQLVRKRLQGFEVVQLDVWDDKTPVLTPGGERLTPKEWAVKLKLFYTPTLLFFDEHGKEIIRVESVVQFFRLGAILRYVADKAYGKFPIFAQWMRVHSSDESQQFMQNMSDDMMPSGKP